MTIFPLGLPQGTRDRLMTLSFQSGEPMAEIIRRAIDKILAQGLDGVIRTSEIRATARTAERAGEASVRAERAARLAQAREQAHLEKAAVAAQKAAAKAQKSETVLGLPQVGPGQPEPPIVESPIDQPTGLVIDQLDRPTPPSPEHTWVRGGINRCGYWRAPKRTKLAI